MHRTTRNISLALIAATSLATAACDSGIHASIERTGAEVRSSTTTTTSITTTTAMTVVSAPADAELQTRTNAKTDPLVAVRAFWDLFIELGANTGPFDASAVRSRISAQATGDELTTLFQFLQGVAAENYVVRGTIDIAPHVVINDGPLAQIRDCIDDHTGVYRITDDTRIDTDNPARHQILMTLRVENGVWKVASIINEGDGCAAS